MAENFIDKMACMLSRIGATVKSIIKVVLSGKGEKISPHPYTVPLVILGNGPSLSRNLQENMSFLKSSDTLAVNFAANTPAFNDIRPKYYVLADPHFFETKDDPNVKLLMTHIAETSWQMTLFVPVGTTVSHEISANSYITVKHFTLTGFESFTALEHIAFSRGWGMPRPRNVLIPSIMLGLRLGYKTIFIIGADHTWTSSLSVDDDNHVVSVQPHFYSDNDKEKERVISTYRDIRLHEILESFSIAFKSYHTIRMYADHIGANIYNATPGSFIDAFERRPLPIH